MVKFCEEIQRKVKERTFVLGGRLNTSIELVVHVHVVTLGSIPAEEMPKAPSESLFIKTNGPLALLGREVTHGFESGVIVQRLEGEIVDEVATNGFRHLLTKTLKKLKEIQKKGKSK